MHRLSTLLFAFTVILSLCQQSYGRPQNIVLFLIDDLGWMDLSCMGSSFYETPNLDRLAREGARFTDAYAACPVCSPTRASIMTGKYPANVGITNFIGGNAKGYLLSAPYADHIYHGEKTLAEELIEKYNVE